MPIAIDNLSLDGGSSNKLSPGEFFNHVFNFDSDNKANMLNLVQYILIGIIPIVLTLKAIKIYIPEEDDTKQTLEISLEVVIQLVSIFFAIWFIDRLIRYFPTYSGVAYHKFNEVNFVLPLLIILVTMQTKLGAKINILVERALDIWNGGAHVGNSNQGNVRVSQPIVTPGIHQVSRADNLDNTLIAPPAQQLPAQNNISMIDALPNMANTGGNAGLSSFQNQAIQNSFMEAMEPMAANGALGGAFGASF
tara:strand:+ start:5978 stop:6727 length:750 start_codon:yes stop_codon:yes gene_type:complete